MLSIGHLLKIAAPNCYFKQYLYTLMMLLLSSSALAGQSLVEIRQGSYQFLLKSLIEKGNIPENLKISVTAPDRRLRLALCKEKIAYFKPQRAAFIGNTTVGIKCDTPRWQIYLPAKIIRLADVWVLTQTTRRGEAITANITHREKRALNQRTTPLTPAFNNFSGVKAARNVRAGAILSSKDICLVCKGDKIELQVNSDNLKVKMYGVAIDNGILGDQITARNSASKKMVTGLVTAAGVLEISL